MGKVSISKETRVTKMLDLDEATMSRAILSWAQANAGFGPKAEVILDEYSHRGCTIQEVAVSYEDTEEALVAGQQEPERKKPVDELPSPTKPGNVRCMDCRCGGFGCPGMPPGYEAGVLRDMGRG